ncbi:MAG: RlmE family RNA methyltransferase [Gammaproteobacteria bacterium]
MPRRSSSSSRWLQRQARDSFVKQSRQDGYRSRAAYKLIEINRRDRLMQAGSRVVDLGAAPGGWTQVAASIVGPRGTVLALDVLKMEPVAGATVIEGDFRTAAVRAAAAAALGGTTVDLVMSDMAPNISGIRDRDEAAAEKLILMALDFAREHLGRGGAMLVKLFEYPGTDELVRELARTFERVSRRKPEASRAGSREFYVVAKGFTPGIGI